MFKKLTLAAIGAVVLLQVPAMAEDAPAVPRTLPPGITPAEASRLRNQHQDLLQLKRKVHADGDVTRREAAVLEHQSAQLRRMAHRAKNN